MIKEASDMVQTCKLNATMQLNLINDLMDLAKQQNMTFSFTKGIFNLVENVEKAFSTLDFISSSRNIQTYVDVKECDRTYLKYIVGDENRF